MRILRNKPFTRFLKKAGLDDAALCKAVDAAERGLIDADLGGGVIKQRVARPGGGKSGGARALILYKKGERAYFVHGFAKNDRDNIDSSELAALKKLASEMLAYDDKAIAQAVEFGTLTEVMCDDKD